MTGVEILATQEVVTAYAFSWGNFWISMCIAMGVCLVFGIIISVDEDCWWNLLIACVGVIVSVVLGLAAGFAHGVPTEYETQYKVTISDEVSMNDFLDKYEIIDQEGKIYTVMERCDAEDGK